MSSIDRFIGIVGMGSTIANTSMLKRFLSNLTVVIALIAISSTMAGVIIMVAFYALYLSLIHYGLEPQAAIIVVSGLAVMVTAVFAVMGVIRWRQLREMPRLMQESPLVSQMGKIANAFAEGLLADRNRRNR